ncbi:Ferric cupric reductase transmembrane component 7 [Lecanosticta acicola]|uniref:ferric-chelate reductase (NADPH) n=1 Tax=Lecanosticta acicola TaxID=111012 RepID=A0AAI8YUR6_9PEZI|nr:Ferric cupric reductase transmembrane component 7 [Lecanosticta acicola]
MLSIAELLAKRAEISEETLVRSAALPERRILEGVSTLEKRVYIPCCNSSSPPGLVEAETVDPWQQSGKYALGWVYFAIILLALTTAVRRYHYWNDKIRVASHEAFMEEVAKTASPATDYAVSAPNTDRSTRKFFPTEGPLQQPPNAHADSSSNWFVRILLGSIRHVFYHPIPSIKLLRKLRPVNFPSPGVCLIVFAALAFVVLYCFVPQPLYWSSIQYGSPPLAIRSGMIAVALMPWIVGLSMKANFISLLTGLGHERLNVLHRWLAYICLFLSLVHTVPFYITPVYDNGGLRVFHQLLKQQQGGVYIYGTGIAALVPILVLCIHSFGPIRRRFYELFVMLHVPVAIVFLGMLFWHCHNYLASWNYLFATTAIWVASYLFRLFYLNWTNPGSISFCIGEEAAVTVLHENAVKVTIPTQMRWKPGQYVYLRMPGISFFENHPFTIASLCSDDYPSEYGENYRDMVVVFRPFGGFTKKVLDSALDHGPWWTYRTFIDGPYGGRTRIIHSFDHVVLIAGGTGITAVVSHLLDIIKRMRDGKAVTKTVHLIWAMKRPETMEWFKEELRICREFAPPDTVSCHFYITAAKRQSQGGKVVSAQTPNRPVSMVFHDKVNDVFQNIASNRYSMGSSHRNSAHIREAAAGDPDREKELREEDEDRLRPLPEAHLKPVRQPSRGHPDASFAERRSGSCSPKRSSLDQSISSDDITEATSHMPPHPTLHEKRRSRGPISLDISSAHNAQATQTQQFADAGEEEPTFDFGFPSTPTEFQKNLMRFAFMPAAVKSRRSGWSVEWGRPEISYMLRGMSQEWTGKRACVFVCGPPSMRVDVSNTVADLQKLVLGGNRKMDEVFLHTENYAL